MLADLVQIDTSPGLADRVYGSLLDAISDGTLAPGVRLTQEGLGASLNVYKMS
jgi:DNA-binding GntR family transcriptional regulator